MSFLAGCLTPLMLHTPVWVDIIELHPVLILQKTGSCKNSCSIISQSREYFLMQSLSRAWCFWYWFLVPTCVKKFILGQCGRSPFSKIYHFDYWVYFSLPT